MRSPKPLNRKEKWNCEATAGIIMPQGILTVRLAAAAHELRAAAHPAAFAALLLAAAAGLELAPRTAALAAPAALDLMIALQLVCRNNPQAAIIFAAGPAMHLALTAILTAAGNLPAQAYQAAGAAAGIHAAGTFLLQGILRQWRSI